MLLPLAWCAGGQPLAVLLRCLWGRGCCGGAPIQPRPCQCVPRRCGVGLPGRLPLRWRGGGLRTLLEMGAMGVSPGTQHPGGQCVAYPVPRPLPWAVLLLCCLPAIGQAGALDPPRCAASGCRAPGCRVRAPAPAPAGGVLPPWLLGGACLVAIPRCELCRVGAAIPGPNRCCAPGCAGAGCAAVLLLPGLPPWAGVLSWWPGQAGAAVLVLPVPFRCAASGCRAPGCRVRAPAPAGGLLAPWLLGGACLVAIPRRELCRVGAAIPGPNRCCAPGCAAARCAAA